MAPDYDVVIIGAGLQGLIVAKTFLQIDRNIKLVVFDNNHTIGGVWGKENLCPGLTLNNKLGTWEYTDPPMDRSLGVRSGQHVPGEVAYKYFCQFARLFDLDKKIQLRSFVHSAELDEHEWKLQLSKGGQPARGVTCRRLVVATGLTSKPNPINLKGSSSFKAPLISYADFSRYAAHLYSDASVQHVTVLGGSKAAHDVVHGMASRGKRVTWVIQASGYGPTPMAPADLQLGPFAVWLEKLLMTRPFTWLCPCIWSHFDGFGLLQSLLQQTRLGQWVVKKSISWMQKCMHDQLGISKHPETRKLLPDKYLMWYGSGSAILNYPTDIYAYIRSSKVSVIRKDIDCLQNSNEIKLADGKVIETDALICSTGWQHTPSIDFRPASIHADLGIPSTQYTSAETEQWARLDTRADIETLQRLPLLRHGPSKPVRQKQNNSDSPSAETLAPQQHTPWRLWRGIAPPSLAANNIVFLGIFTNPQSALRAEVSSLWAYAYLFGELSLPIKSISLPSKPITSMADRLYDTALFQRYGRWRTPYGHGAKHADATFEGLPYVDMLLCDLGLRRWRKGWGWLGEVFGGGYWQGDYRGLVEEWLEKRERGRELTCGGAD